MHKYSPGRGQIDNPQETNLNVTKTCNYFKHCRVQSLAFNTFCDTFLFSIFQT